MNIRAMGLNDVAIFVFMRTIFRLQCYMSLTCQAGSGKAILNPGGL
jgi:hypothetical protein